LPGFYFLHFRPYSSFYLLKRFSPSLDLFSGVSLKAVDFFFPPLLLLRDDSLSGAASGKSRTASRLNPEQRAPMRRLVPLTYESCRTHVLQSRHYVTVASQSILSMFIIMTMYTTTPHGKKSHGQ
jgi:hypothetical protein